MKLTNENFDQNLSLYLNDVEDYGDESQFILFESVLFPLDLLLTESDIKPLTLLEEKLKSSSTYEREIIEDFKLYVENI